MAKINVHMSSNIINEGRRSRRKIVPLSINPQPSDEISLDLGSQEPSEGDESDDGEEYAAASEESD